MLRVLIAAIILAVAQAASWTRSVQVSWPAETLERVHGYICKNFPIMNRAEFSHEVASSGMRLLGQAGPWRVAEYSYRSMSFVISNNEYPSIIYTLNLRFNERGEIVGMSGEFTLPNN